MIDALLVHVRYIDAAIGTNFDVDGSEPLVTCLHWSREVFGLKRGLKRLETAHYHLALQRFDAEQAPVVIVG